MRHGMQGAAHTKLSSFTKREFQRLLHTVEIASYSVEGSRVYSELRYLAIKHLAEKLIARRSGSESELVNAGRDTNALRTGGTRLVARQSTVLPQLVPRVATWFAGNDGRAR